MDTNVYNQIMYWKYVFSQYNFCLPGEGGIGHEDIVTLKRYWFHNMKNKLQETEIIS